MTIDDTKMTEPMSKEEMIDTLEGLVFGTFDRTTAKEREALDMAIQALEQISHLTDRPCSVCEFHKEDGCSKWECVFETERGVKG